MSQCSDEIKSGDVLWVPSEGSAALLLGAWPVAVNENYITDKEIVLLDNEGKVTHTFYQRFHGVRGGYKYEDQEPYQEGHAQNPEKYANALTVARALVAYND